MEKKSLLSEKAFFICFAWIAVLGISDLPDLVSQTLFNSVPPWLFWAKTAFIALLTVTAILWQRIRPLWSFYLVMTVFMGSFALISLVRSQEWWLRLFPGNSFYRGFLGLFLLDMIIALAVIGALQLTRKKRSAYFLVKGDLKAPIGQIRWLGIRGGESWKKFTLIFALAAGAGILFPTVFSIRPTSADLARALPLLPGVVLFAAINAFTEETYYRLTLFSTLTELLGKNQVMALNIFLFGMAHYLYGSPPGIIGFALTGFLAYLLGKSILETRGMASAWFIHFVPDVVVFFSYALTWFR